MKNKEQSPLHGKDHDRGTPVKEPAGDVAPEGEEYGQKKKKKKTRRSRGTNAKGNGTTHRVKHSKAEKQSNDGGGVIFQQGGS